MSNTQEYQAMAAEVAEDLRENGKSAAIVRPGSSEGWTKKFNALTGAWYWEDGDGVIVTEDPETATEIPCFVLEDRFAIQHIDGTLVQANDRLFLCSEQPQLGDEFHVDVIDGAFQTVLTVVQAIPLRPGEITIYTEVHAR